MPHSIPPFAFSCFNETGLSVCSREWRIEDFGTSDLLIGRVCGMVGKKQGGASGFQYMDRIGRNGLLPSPCKTNDLP